jgi:hypothetical protein
MNTLYQQKQYLLKEMHLQTKLITNTLNCSTFVQYRYIISIKFIIIQFQFICRVYHKVIFPN